MFVKVHRGVLCVTTNRSDGSKLKIAEVEIADETGRARLKLINEQCELTSLNNTLVLRECLVRNSENYIRIELDRFSSIEKSPIAMTKEIDDKVLLI